MVSETNEFRQTNTRRRLGAVLLGLGIVMLLGQLAFSVCARRVPRVVVQPPVRVAPIVVQPDVKVERIVVEPDVHVDTRAIQEARDAAEVVEVRALPALPELPRLPDLPELPEMPALPELPDLPVVHVRPIPTVMPSDIFAVGLILVGVFLVARRLRSQPTDQPATGPDADKPPAV